jgi:hypothetical protein
MIASSMEGHSVIFDARRAPAACIAGGRVKATAGPEALNE